MFGWDYLNYLAEMEAIRKCRLANEDDAALRKITPVGSAFPLPFALALAVFSIATVVVGIWHL